MVYLHQAEKANECEQINLEKIMHRRGGKIGNGIERIDQEKIRGNDPAQHPSQALPLRREHHLSCRRIDYVDSAQSSLPGGVRIQTVLPKFS